MFSLFSKSKVVGTGILIDGLYKLNLHASYSESLYVNNLGTKRTLIKENSYSLWHRRLGRISKERIQTLVSSGAIGPLDYSDLGVCTDCIKGKQTNIRKFGTRRSSSVLIWCIQTFVVHSLQLLGMVMNISSLYRQLLSL